MAERAEFVRFFGGEGRVSTIFGEECRVCTIFGGGGRVCTIYFSGVVNVFNQTTLTFNLAFRPQLNTLTMNVWLSPKLQVAVFYFSETDGGRGLL